MDFRCCPFLFTHIAKGEIMIVKFCSVLIAAVFLYTHVSAQSDSLSIKFTLKGEPTQSANINMEVGVKYGATDTLDVQFGEKEIPPFWPPTGLAARMEIFSPSKNKNIYSYRDFRAVENQDRFSKTYELQIAPTLIREGDKDDSYREFYINWEPLSEYIDSARIQDKATGDIINIDLKKGTQYRFTHEFIEELVITVHYNMTPGITSVDEVYPENSKIKIYPNPANDKIYLGNTITKYKIISVVGAVMLEGKALPSESVDLTGLPSGAYAIQVEAEGIKTIRRFIKK
jgi:hypothetical protein